MRTQRLSSLRTSRGSWHNRRSRSGPTLSAPASPMRELTPSRKLSGQVCTLHTSHYAWKPWSHQCFCSLKTEQCSGIAAGNPEIPIRINLIAPPVYVMTCSTPDKADGLAVLTDGCKVAFVWWNWDDDTIVQAVEEKIVGSGGNFVMQMAPKVN